MTPSVSVVISVHNGANSINQAITSVNQQSFSDWRLICVDDASTDQTGQILRHWQGELKDKLTIITNQQNLGLTKSLNIAITQSNTQYIARLDADDWWESNKLSHQIKFMQKNPDCGLIGCCYTNHYPKHQKNIKLPTTNITIRQSIFRRNPFGHSCVIFKKNLWQRVGGYDNNLRFGQDLDLWFKLLPLTKFYNLPVVLCHRRISQQPHKSQQVINHIKTIHHYIQKYNANPINYAFLAEPIAAGLWHKLYKS